MAHVLASLVAEPAAEIRRAQEPGDRERCARHRAHQQAGAFVDHLERDAADGARRHRPALPQRLRDRQREPFAQRLLHHHHRPALQRVDGEVRIGREERDRDVRALAGLLPHFGQDLRALGVVVGAAAREHQVRVLALAQQQEGLDHPDRILDAIEA